MFLKNPLDSPFNDYSTEESLPGGWYHGGTGGKQG